MKSRLSWRLLVATTLLLTAGTASAAVIYTFDGDANTGWIVDTDSATFTSFGTDAVGIGYPVSVRDTVIVAAGTMAVPSNTTSLASPLATHGPAAVISPNFLTARQTESRLTMASNAVARRTRSPWPT